MSQKLKPASPKAWALLEKLQALAEKGIDGEKTSAEHKIARLKARYDFSGASPAETPNLFSGTFQRARKARPIYSFPPAELDLANCVKWAIESGTKIQCLYREGHLLTEATPPTAKRLKEIAVHIAGSFRALLAKFDLIDGVSVSDRATFVMGLYDGMMNERREVGQRLPGGVSATRKRKGKKVGTAQSSGLHVHPYTLAVSLGKQIRFSTPVEQITAELDAVITRHLGEGQRE